MIIHYKLHSHEGAAWCGQHIEAYGTDEKVTCDHTATDREGSVSCKACNDKIAAFTKQIAEARADRQDHKYVECRRA